MSFNWNFRREPDLTNYIGAQIDPYNASRIASENIRGYRPNTAFTPGTPAEQAAAAMNGYRPNPQGGQFSVPNVMHGGMGQPNLEGYGESLHAASDAAAREQQIADIESQIATIEKRIATNTAKLRSFTGNADRIAAIEARKINGVDPTSIWKWKQGQDQAAAIRQQDLERAKLEKEAAKELAKRQALNKVTNTLGTINIGLNTTPDQIQQYRNTLASLMSEAQNAELEDLSAITKMQERLNRPLPYDVMEDLKDQMDLYNKNFESVVGDGTYGSNKNYDTYVENLNKLWSQATPEMQKDRNFKLAYDTAKAAHARKKTNPPKFRRK